MLALRKEMLIPLEVLGERWSYRRSPISPQCMRMRQVKDLPLRRAIQRNMTVFSFARTVGPTTRKKRSAGGAVEDGPRVSMCETA